MPSDDERRLLETTGGRNGSSRSRRPGQVTGLRGSGSRWRPLANRRPNMLIVGASGHVAQAFLLRLQARRDEFERLVLLDQTDRVVEDAFLDHERLDYLFLQRRLCLPQDTRWFHELLARHQIDIVLDLTDLDTLPILEATDAAGVSYVNTALNDARRGVGEIVSLLHPIREEKRNAAHIISSGMNPGVVNIWVWHCFKQYGAPREIIHFEYDTSMPVTGWRPMITWSRQEFLTETLYEPTGLVLDGKLKMFETNSFVNRQDMRAVMEPVLAMERYPSGLLVLHEENVKLGQKLGASSKYLYAVHPRTMDYLDRLWKEQGRVEIGDLELGDNTTTPLTGSDTIGVCLKYPEKRVYYLHSLDNSEVTGTNATCAQVSVGVDAALTTLLRERLSPRLYFASDLYDTVYTRAVFSSLRVERFEMAGKRRSAGVVSSKWRCRNEIRTEEQSIAGQCGREFPQDAHAGA